MSQKCKELENKVKDVGENPILAKETYLELAQCYEKIHQTKNAFKAYEKVAKISVDIASKFDDPEEAQKFYDEAVEYYAKIKKTKDVLKIKTKAALHYVEAAKILYNTKVRIIYAIKYLKVANKIFEELKDSDSMTQNNQMIQSIQQSIGLPIEEIDSILEEHPKPPLIQEPPILEAREFEKTKQELEESRLESEKARQKERKLEEKKRKEEKLEKERLISEEQQKYKKGILSQLVKEGKTAEEIKEFKESLSDFEEEEKSKLSSIDELLKKKGS